MRLIGIPKMSSDGTDHLTREELERIESFLNLFTAIEAELQRRLRVPTTTPFNRLLRDYRQQNPYGQDDADDLGHYAQIRNFLTHERNPELGYPVAAEAEVFTEDGLIDAVVKLARTDPVH